MSECQFYKKYLYTPPLVRTFVEKHKNSHAKSQSNATSELNGAKHGFTLVECKFFVGFTFSEYGKKTLILIINNFNN